MTKVSSLYETDPVGGPADQPAFINAVAQIETALSAPRLLAVCQKIEAMLGRKRGAGPQAVDWGPRTIDLDLLIYGDEVHSSAALTIPHLLMLAAVRDGAIRGNRPGLRPPDAEPHRPADPRHPRPCRG